MEMSIKQHPAKSLYQMDITEVLTMGEALVITSMVM
jgi:hypothetical protein